VPVPPEILEDTPVDSDKEDTKLKDGIFVGPDIRKLLSDDLLETTMKTVEREAWNAFKEVIAKLLGNYKDPKYKQIVEKVRKVYSVRLCHELKSAFPKCSSGLLFGKSWRC
jgi:hypothetical protein